MTEDESMDTRPHPWSSRPTDRVPGECGANGVGCAVFDRLVALMLAAWGGANTAFDFTSDQLSTIPTPTTAASGDAPTNRGPRSTSPATTSFTMSVP